MNFAHTLSVQSRFLLSSAVFLLTLPWLTGCTRGVTQETAQTGSALTSPEVGQDPLADKKPQKVMCMWNAWGKRQYMCGDPPKEEVQKKCDEKAREDRKEQSATCSCSDDPSYVRDMCDDGVEPPVNDGWRRRG